MNKTRSPRVLGAHLVERSDGTWEADTALGRLRFECETLGELGGCWSVEWDVTSDDTHVMTVADGESLDEAASRADTWLRERIIAPASEIACAGKEPTDG